MLLKNTDRFMTQYKHYNVEAEEGRHFQIETVNRYLIEDDIEGKIHNVK